MVKYIIGSLIIVAVIVGLVFWYISKAGNSPLPVPAANPTKPAAEINNVTPSASSQPVSEKELDQDMTALDKDLQDLNTADSEINNELNNL